MLAVFRGGIDYQRMLSAGMMVKEHLVIKRLLFYFCRNDGGNACDRRASRHGIGDDISNNMKHAAFLYAYHAYGEALK